jgi:RND superfamily putative drug exporter
VAIALDATLVRGVLLPATMVLLGERNWYLPRWLAWLPGGDRRREATGELVPAGAGG